MPARNLHRPPVVVMLPDEIDMTSREDTYDQLHAAFASGAPVVVADLTATTFCDCASLRRLIAVQDRAAAQGTHLRLVIPPGSPVHRLSALLSVERRLPVYPSLRDAGVPEGPGQLCSVRLSGTP